MREGGKRKDDLRRGGIFWKKRKAERSKEQRWSVGRGRSQGAQTWSN